MYTRYFRKKNPKCKPEETEWIEMTGREFYLFVNSPEGQNRHFIDMDDVVLEASETEARRYKAEKNHSYYIQSQEDGWSTMSIYATEDENGYSGVEVIQDDSQDVESQAIMRIERKALRLALNQLDEKSRLLIQMLYLLNDCKTERELAHEYGVSQAAIHKQKKKILETIKYFVIKIQKSQQ